MFLTGWLSAAQHLGGGGWQKKRKIPDIVLNVYTLTIFFIWILNYKKVWLQFLKNDFGVAGLRPNFSYSGRIFLCSDQGYRHSPSCLPFGEWCEWKWQRIQNYQHSESENQLKMVNNSDRLIVDMQQAVRVHCSMGFPKNGTTILIGENSPLEKITPRTFRKFTYRGLDLARSLT
jgi:hypothetical protein